MKFTKNGSRATMNGPADWFTGKVLVDNVKSPDEQSAVGAGHVRFTPGARTAWHTHPQGQLLYVTDGEGRVATRDGVKVIRPGDSIFIKPGDEHWHGAAPDHFMAHVAIAPADEDGNVADWGEHVTDEEYNVKVEEA
mgnify:FL=1